MSDIFDSAQNPEIVANTNVYWGQCNFGLQYVVLQKGVGKVPFNPSVHTEREKRTAINISLTPLAAMGLRFDVARDCIAEFGDWPKLVLPSINTLGVTVRGLNGAWVKVHLEPNGETYQKKDTGERVAKTVLVFDTVFPDQASCQMDYDASNLGRGSVASASASAPAYAPAPASAQYAPNGGPVDEKEKSTAFKFLRVIVATTVRDFPAPGAERDAALAAAIAQYPAVTKYFTVQSPETVGLIEDAEVPF